MELDENKMSLHSDLVEIVEKYETVLSVETTGHTMVQYGTEHMLWNSAGPGLAILTANQAIADAIRNYTQGNK